MATHAARRLSPVPPIELRRGSLTRVRVRLSRAGLDARLAAGEPAADDPALEVRAAQLRSSKVRRRVAAALESACVEASSPPAIGAALPVHRAAVKEARPALEQLISALRSSEPGEAQGVALAARLLTNAAGPLYAPSDLDALCCSAREALLALIRRERRRAPVAP
jgi:hypothetical protein